MATTANNWQTPGASDPGRYTPERACRFELALLGKTLYTEL